MNPTQSYWKGICVVYRVLDSGGRLIYLGASQNLHRRFKDHRRETWWYELIHRVQVRLYPNMAAAFAAEAVAIQEEQPAFNERHTGREGNWSHWTAGDFQTCINWQKTNGRRGHLPQTSKPRLVWSA